MKSVILAGGSGTHLWPLSRKQYPKQFLKFGKYSLFQEAFLRCTHVSNLEEIFVVTNKNLKFFVVGQIQEIGYEISWDNVLVEPLEKNTLPAICYAVKTIQKRFKDSIVGVFPSDHFVDKQIMEMISSAESLASEGSIVTFGIPPSSANTNYGYLKSGVKKGVGKKVVEFHEKPNETEAKKYVNQDYYWNSGIFLFHTSTFFDELKKYSLDLFKIFNENENIDFIYKKTPSISIDYGILEKTQNIILVPIKNHWNDLDDFSDLYDQLDHDANGNVVYDCDFSAVNAKNDLVYGKNGKLISLIDVQDMIVVDTADALLISPRKDSAKVKQVVEELKNKGDERVLTGQTVYRPWGSYTVLESSENHVIKKICVYEKHRLSLQLHHHRSEHWVVVSGTAEVNVNGKDFFVRPGESTFIRVGEKHRLGNPSDTIPLEIIEVQLGEYVGEDDIVRFDDEYGRK